jgi:hypothetical protein
MCATVDSSRAAAAAAEQQQNNNDASCVRFDSSDYSPTRRSDFTVPPPSSRLSITLTFSQQQTADSRTADSRADPSQRTSTSVAINNTTMVSLFEPFHHEHLVSTPPPVPLDDEEVLTVSEAEIAQAVEIAPVVYNGVVRLSENTLVKYGYHVTLGEARTMQFVYTNAPSVRLPKCLRSFQIEERKGSFITYIVMEYIHGTVLSDCWNEMSEYRRQHVCDQLVDTLFQLRSLRTERPGPIGGGMCRTGSDLFSLRGAGPFDSIRELEDWYSHRMFFCKKLKRLPPDTPSFEGTFGDRMVMSHLDIAKRNIIVQADDVICLVDWGFAGAYPTHFERAALEHHHTIDNDLVERVLARLPEHKEAMEKLKSVDFALTSF